MLIQFFVSLSAFGKGLTDLSEAIISAANVGSGILEVCSWDQVAELGLDKTTVANPTNLLH